MSDKSAFLGMAALLAGALTACGQTGPLYLPEAASEVVTRPAATPPPAAPPSPTPEVTAPEGLPEADDPKKEKGAARPPPPPK